jgi:cyclomaltodextrinase
MDPNGDGDPSDGVDGWRLDVANDVSHVFWREWRSLVKSINPDAYIVGEIWDNAKDWLKGDEFDAVMNYRFARACVRFFIDTNERRYTPSEFAKELDSVRRDYSEQTNYVLQNLLESHDTDRLPSQIMNPNREFNKEGGIRNNPRYDISAPTTAARRIQKMMILFQMTYVGAPMVYYGGEAGMWGANDPDDRKPMVWEDLVYEDERAVPTQSTNSDGRQADPVQFNKDMFAWYQKLIGIRNGNETLRRGTFSIVSVDDSRGLVVFDRGLSGNTIRVVLNNSQGEQVVPVSGSFVNLLTGENGADAVRVEGTSGVVLRLRQ